MLKNISCNNLPDLAKIWLVPEPLDETKPLYSCRIHRLTEQDPCTIEVDFMDIVENTSPCLKSAVGSVDVSIGSTAILFWQRWSRAACRSSF